MFSLLIANYNNGVYFYDCYESIIRQDYDNWEVIIIDDCSTDDSFYVIKSIVGKDKRFKIFRNEENMGCGFTKNKCAALAKGDILAFLDPDDAITPNAMRVMVREHEKYPQASLINSNCFHCDNDLNVLGMYDKYKPIPPGGELLLSLSVGAFASFKRSAYVKTEGINPKFLRAIDHDLYLKLDEVGTLRYINEPLYMYRSNPAGISQGKNGIRAAQFSIKAKLDAFNRRKGKVGIFNISLKEARQLKKIWFSRELYHLRQSNKPNELKVVLKEAISEFPLLLLKRSYLIHLTRIIFKNTRR